MTQRDVTVQRKDEPLEEQQRVIDPNFLATTFCWIVRICKKKMIVSVKKYFPESLFPWDFVRTK